jgi:hypothetical protein
MYCLALDANTLHGTLFQAHWNYFLPQSERQLFTHIGIVAVKKLAKLADGLTLVLWWQVQR